jgi:hypothetical protein
MRAREFVIVERKNQQVDEILPALGAAAGILGRGALAAGGALGRGALSAGGALGRGALSLGRGAMSTIGSIGGDALSAAGDLVGGAAQGIGSAVGGVAKGIGSAVGGVSQGVTNASAGGQQQQQSQQIASLKPGSMYNHPSLGSVKVLPPIPGQKGVRLDTTQKLGFPIAINPDDLGQR